MPIPKYAEGVPVNLLVKVLCKGKCSRTRYMRVSNPNWSRSDYKNNGHDMDNYAECLFCGRRQYDTYNWIRYI
jgi:hypothetical protein